MGAAGFREGARCGTKGRAPGAASQREAAPDGPPGFFARTMVGLGSARSTPRAVAMAVVLASGAWASAATAGLRSEGARDAAVVEARARDAREAALAGPAGLLAEPPKLLTFQLDDPAAPRLPLLRSFLNAEIERPGPVRNYLWSRWGQWGRRPWWTLSWLGDDRGEGDDEDRSRAEDDEGRDDRDEGDETSEPLLSRLVLALARATESASTEWEEPSDAAASDAFLSVASLEAQAAEGSLLRIGALEPPTWLARLHPDWTPPLLASTGPSLHSNGFDAIFAPPPKPIPWWRCPRRPVTFVRHGGESDRFALLRCDGSVAPDALDRLSIIARPVETERPGDRLPDDPDPEAWSRHEWVANVRLVHPRLLWLLQRVAEAFPGRAIYVYSGYRPGASVRRGGGAHGSLHAEARAMDIAVTKVPNEALFAFCRKLNDVGCGYYPNSKFVHVDVRRPGAGRAFWIDVSAPGEPSRYVDSWPGVVDSGALAWSARR